MAENSEVTKTNNEIMYAFRFSSSNQRVCLNQKQLDRIPYLSVLVGHKDDFLSIQNENSEYVLSPPVHYNCFMAILRLITIEQPYALFTELSEDENVLDTLQLFDYLGINSFSSPLLKGKHLTLSNPINDDTNEKSRIEYHRTNLSEARNTAAQFIISIAKNEYGLYDVDTLGSIFDLIMVIFSNNDVFSSRFRHHALTIVKECCLSLFSKQQQHQLPTIQQIAQGSTMDSWIYLYDDDQPLPENFENAFAWKGVYKLIEDIDTSHFFKVPLNLIIVGRAMSGKAALIKCLLDQTPFTVFQEYQLTPMIESCNNKNDYINEGQSARSGRFNTLPKRPNVDKFKHRFGPKNKKYR